MKIYYMSLEEFSVWQGLMYHPSLALEFTV